MLRGEAVVSLGVDVGVVAGGRRSRLGKDDSFREGGREGMGAMVHFPRLLTCTVFVFLSALEPALKSWESMESVKK